MRPAIAFVTFASAMAAVGAHDGQHPPSSTNYSSTIPGIPVSSVHQTVISTSTFSSAISTSTKTIGSHVTSVKKVPESSTGATTFTTGTPTTSVGYTRNLTQSTKELVTTTSAPGFNGSNHTSTPSFSPVPTSAGGVISPFGAAVFAVAVAGIMCLGF